jgi:DNA-binding MarR family transcriptional regulator
MSGAGTDFDLLQHLPHLLRRAHFDAETIFAREFGTAVTSRQLALLTVVDRIPGASQSRVAAEIGLDLNTCSDLVARTVDKGLLRRERSAQDARSFALHLTPAGRAAARKGVREAPAYQAAVAGRLSAAEQRRLTALLRKLLGVG